MLCGLCQLQMSSYTLVEQQPFTCVPWRQIWISIHASSSSPPGSWLKSDKLPSATLGLLLIFARQEESSILRCQKRACQAPCCRHWERVEVCASVQEGRLQWRGELLEDCSKLSLSGQLARWHPVATDWVTLHGKHVRNWRLSLMGVLPRKNSRIPPACAWFSPWTIVKPKSEKLSPSGFCPTFLLIFWQCSYSECFGCFLQPLLC